MNIFYLIMTFLLINKSSQRLGYDDEISTLPPHIEEPTLLPPVITSSQVPPYFSPPWWSWRRWLWNWRWWN